MDSWLDGGTQWSQLLISGHNHPPPPTSTDHKVTIQHFKGTDHTLTLPDVNFTPQSLNHNCERRSN